jgi:hypothetical protein
VHVWVVVHDERGGSDSTDCVLTVQP